VNYFCEKLVKLKLLFTKGDFSFPSVIPMTTIGKKRRFLITFTHTSDILWKKRRFLIPFASLRSFEMTGDAGVLGVKRAALCAALFTPFSLSAGVTPNADVERSGTS